MLPSRFNGICTQTDSGAAQESKVHAQFLVLPFIPEGHFSSLLSVISSLSLAYSNKNECQVTSCTIRTFYLHSWFILPWNTGMVLHPLHQTDSIKSFWVPYHGVSSANTNFWFLPEMPQLDKIHHPACASGAFGCLFTGRHCCLHSSQRQGYSLQCLSFWQVCLFILEPQFHREPLAGVSQQRCLRKCNPFLVQHGCLHLHSELGWGIGVEEKILKNTTPWQ